MVLRMEIGFPANGRTVNSRELEKILFQFLPECVKTTLYYHVLPEKEVEAVERILRDGVPVNDNTMVEVLDLCEYLGLDFGSYFGDYRPPVKKDVFKGNY